MALKVGQMAPDFTLTSHTGASVKLSDYRGKNVVLVFFPLAWTPVWTGQIPSYEALKDKFEGMETQVLGLSVDSKPCLAAWAESLGGISYPLLSDFYPHGMVAVQYGVLRAEGYSERAIFVLDKEGLIRYVDVHDIDKQPDNDVLLRVLETIDPVAAAKLGPSAPAAPSVEPDAEIVMYCTSWCPGCRRARAWFAEKKIPFVEVDITKDRMAAARVREWNHGNETTPTFKIHGQLIVEFDVNKVEKALGLKW
jgi:peroxiredoxin/glutaredoxin